MEARAELRGPESPDHAPPALAAPDAFMQAALQMGIAFEGDDVHRLEQYLHLLLEANTRFNLTAIADPAEAWMRHILDSLTLLPLIAAQPPPSRGEAPLRIVDVGSGGGLPGVPLAIGLPGAQFTLLEATGKKARFLERAAAQLGLVNVRVLPERAESAGRDAAHHRARYDLVLARAVGRLPTLLELTVPLARVGGLVLAIKGERAGEEIAAATAALQALRARISQTISTATRSVIIVIEKLEATPRKYPRPPGEPKHRPL